MIKIVLPIIIIVIGCSIILYTGLFVLNKVRYCVDIPMSRDSTITFCIGHEPMP